MLLITKYNLYCSRFCFENFFKIEIKLLNHLLLKILLFIFNLTRHKQFKTIPKQSGHHKKKVANNNSLAFINARLPPNWKCKKNQKGTIYYYNEKTKKSQWNFPLARSKLSSNKLISKQNSGEPKSKEIIIKNTPSVEETETKSSISPSASQSKSYIEDPIGSSTSLALQTPKSPPQSESSSSSSSHHDVTNSSTSEIFKIYKDQFRDKLSRLVIKLLQPYLRRDCKNGHITNNNDFKHLARKFTHTILEKEISRTTKLEELDLDKRIKSKAHEFVSKYMLKFEGPYSRSMDTGDK